MSSASLVVYLVRYSEIGLKGPRARKNMEKTLVHNISSVLAPHGDHSISVERGRIFIQTSIGHGTVSDSLSRVFGIKSFSHVQTFTFQSLDQLLDIVTQTFRDRLKGKKFAVRCRRSGNHSFTSLEVERLAGEMLFPFSGGVSLKNPDIEVDVELRDDKAYLYSEVIKGPGGMPLSSQGRMLALMSGGIDSPVAAWYLMKRGSTVSLMFCALAHPVDTISFLDSAAKLFGRWLNGTTADIYIVDGRQLIEETVKSGGLKYPNVTFKRVIYRVAQRLAIKDGLQGLITGESLGQVSSQTSANLEALSSGMVLPVYRPLIGLDKDEIMDVARRIGTYPESDPGEFCSLFSTHPAIAVTADDLKSEVLPEGMVEGMAANAIRISSGQIIEYRKSLIGEDLRRYSVDQDALVIDMRNREDFRRAHYPGAVNVKLAELGIFSETMEKRKPVLLYCKKGLQSAYAATMLRKRGFSAFYTDEKIIRKN